MGPLELVRLAALMDRTEGSADVSIGLVDGPVATEHPEFARDRIRAIAGTIDAACVRHDSGACRHGTFVAGILSAQRTSVAPAICPGCTLLIRPIFAESSARTDGMPVATPGQLATAITDCVAAGARVINLSLGLTNSSSQGEQALEEALTSAARRGIIVAAAAGNQGARGTSGLTRHQWVIPVTACDGHGTVLEGSNLGKSTGWRGLRAPGHSVTSLSATGGAFTAGGASAAVAFVTGAVALLWSEFPTATATQIKLSITHTGSRRRSVVPPLLDAASAHRVLATVAAGRRVHGDTR